MIKKIIYTTLIVLLLLIVGFFMAAGKVVDGQMNVRVTDTFPDYPIEVEQFHDSLIIADWHSDNLLWDRNPLQRLNHGHVDVPRLLEGNFTLQVFDCVIKTPKGQNYDRNSADSDNITLLAIANKWPPKTWFNLTQRAVHQSNVLHRAAAQSNDSLRLVKSQMDLQRLLTDRSTNKHMVGGLLAIEGLHALEGEIGNLKLLYEKGFRLMGLTHFFDNKVGGSSAGEVQGGLTDFGREVIRAMDDQSIIIDLAHASHQLIDDVLMLTNRPVVVSHTGVKGTYDSPRNLSDQHIRKIADRGGMIGIGFWDGAVGDFQPSSIVRAMRYVKDLVGVEHICLGSDWDGGTTILFDSSDIIVLTNELMKSGFTRHEIRRIMGENQIEFLLDNLPPT